MAWARSSSSVLPRGIDLSRYLRMILAVRTLICIGCSFQGDGFDDHLFWDVEYRVYKAFMGSGLEDGHMVPFASVAGCQHESDGLDFVGFVVVQVVFVFPLGR